MLRFKKYISVVVFVFLLLELLGQAADREETNGFVRELTRLQLLKQRNSLGTDTSKMQHAIYPLIGSESAYDTNDVIFNYDPSIQLNKKGLNKIRLRAYPLFGLNAGGQIQEGNSSGFNRSSIGGHFGVSVGTRFEFKVNYIEHNARLNAFENHFVEQNDVVPGQGYAYAVGDRTFFRDLNGYAAYRASKHFHLQLGRGKNFIGDGYRSLLLSDVGYNYDYFKMTTDFWKVRYVNLFTHMTDVRFSNGRVTAFEEKYTAMHYLSIQPTKRWNLGLFEAVIWQADDSISHRGFDVNYVNPIIFYRPVEFSVGSPDNVIIGLNSSVIVSKSVKLYGQFLLDEFKIDELRARDGWWANKYSIQLGAYYFNAFNVEDLTFQAEYNVVRPFTYSHGNVLMNYGHFNQPLSHPLGANFQEGVAIVNYVKERWMLEFKSTVALVGTESASDTISSGTDIFKSYSLRERERNYSLPGLDAEKLATAEVRANYLVNKASNLQLEARLGYRVDTRSGAPDFWYARIGLRTALFNRYNDY